MLDCEECKSNNNNLKQETHIEVCAFRISLKNYLKKINAMKIRWENCG